MVVIKRGADGAVATDGSQWWSCAAHKVAVTDPVGAGDAFAAGFLSSWYRDRDTAGALRSATVTAGLAMTAAADIDALPSRPDLDSIISGDIDVRR
jgi:sugar/nucleoside kinase (ribokinase family)